MSKNKVPGSLTSSPSSVRSKTSKKGLLGLFKNRKKSSSSIFSSPAPSTAATQIDIDEDGESSSEDDYSWFNPGFSENPLSFKSSVLNGLIKSGTQLLDSHDSNHNSFDVLDEQYKQYLKQPKYMKTFRKTAEPVDITKRIFLAQELNQNLGTETGGLDTDSRADDYFSLKGASNECVGTGINDCRKNNSTSSIGKSKNTIWALKFSPDGKYLATAGKSANINIWKVIDSPLTKLQDKYQVTKENEAMYAAVFLSHPTKVFHGHTHDVISLDWSKNNFCISSSMDKTVKLWNLNHDKALRTFYHGDFVTGVKFHPTDDRFFVSGCLDHKVRLWSVIDNEVSLEFDAKDLVTAVGFTPNGSLVILGTFGGVVYFLDTLTFELRHLIELNKQKSAAKVTGIETFVDGDDVKILISSNHSSIRLLSLRQRQLEYYFKGALNESSQIIATVNDDDNYIISGSENHWVYVWNKKKPEHHHHHDPFNKIISKKKKRSDYTAFHVSHSMVTCAVIAPLGTAKTLSLSDDFIYEVNTKFANSGTTEAQTASLFNKDFIGPIIATADDDGIIRIFRQDFSSRVRKAILGEDKKRRNSGASDNPNIITNAPVKDQIYQNKNESTASLLARGYSFRKNAGSDDEQKNRGRSRNSTIVSVNGKRAGGDRTGVVCDVCGGDTFTGAINESRMDKKMSVICKDCGNYVS